VRWLVRASAFESAAATDVDIEPRHDKIIAKVRFGS
jgi:hypothetical protein